MHSLCSQIASAGLSEGGAGNESEGKGSGGLNGGGAVGKSENFEVEVDGGAVLDATLDQVAALIQVESAVRVLKETLVSTDGELGLDTLPGVGWHGLVDDQSTVDTLNDDGVGLVEDFNGFVDYLSLERGDDLGPVFFIVGVLCKRTLNGSEAVATLPSEAAVNVFVDTSEINIINLGNTALSKDNIVGVDRGEVVVNVLLGPRIVLLKLSKSDNDVVSVFSVICSVIKNVVEGRLGDLGEIVLGSVDNSGHFD